SNQPLLFSSLHVPIALRHAAGFNLVPHPLGEGHAGVGVVRARLLIPVGDGGVQADIAIAPLVALVLLDVSREASVKWNIVTDMKAAHRGMPVRVERDEWLACVGTVKCGERRLSGPGVADIVL